MRKILSLCLVLLLLLTCCLTASAAENGKLLHAYYGFDGYNLMALGAQLPEGTTTITLASQENLPSEITTIAEGGLGTTVYCVVDTSSSMPRQAMDREIGILRAISESLGEKDSMVIMTAGETISEGPLLDSPEKREKAISEISFKSKYTDLYLAVSNALDSLTTKTEYRFHKCLLVLSDGKDDGRTSMTEDAVLSKIEKLTVPVFGVGAMQDHPSDYSRSLTNTLERMAAASVGGGFYETSSQGGSVKEIADGVWEAVQNASVFSVDISILNRSKLDDSFLLTVRHDTGNAIYEDSISILTVDLPAGKTAGSGQITIPVTEPEKQTPVLLIVVACVALAVVIAAVVVVILKKKSARKKKGSAAMPTGTVSATVPIAQAAPMGVETPCMEVREAGAESVQSVEPAAKATVPSLQLHLTVIGQKGQFFAFTLPENQPKVIGRDDRADVVLLINGEADTKLSGKHCTMQWTDGRVFVCDNNSTNGTFVNGSQVIPGSLQQLEEGCILRIGSREYRLSMGPQA